MLAREDIEFIKSNIGEWLAEQSLGKPPAVYEIELRERMVRVEEALRYQGEELKAQRELIRDFMAQVDRRFEELWTQIDRRFEQIDKRFEQMDKRFEQVDKRLDQVDKRLDQVDKRLDQIDRRLDQQHQDIMSIHHELKRQMRWFFGTTVAVGGFVVAILRLWPL